MKLPFISRFWNRLSLSARLMLVFSVAVTMLGATYISLVVQSEIKFHSADLHERLNYEIDFMTPALAEPAVVGDYSLIQQMLDVRVNQPHIAEISWTDNRGNRILSVGEETPLITPPPGSGIGWTCPRSNRRRTSSSAVSPTGESNFV